MGVKIDILKKSQKFSNAKLTKKTIDLGKMVFTIVINRFQSMENARAQKYFLFKKLWWTILKLGQQQEQWKQNNFNQLAPSGAWDPDSAHKR